MISPIPKVLNAFNVGEEVATAGTADSESNIPSLLGYTIERPVNILVVGIDRVPDAEVGSDEAFEGHTDTMLLIRFDPGDQTVRMLSIPRDTQVPIPGVGVRKINDANIHGGKDLLQEVVSETLNGVTIDRYVRVTNDAFRELVDLVGGIEVYVPRDMKYSDKTQGLEIDLKQGLQRLNGAQAEQFARFRKDEFGDISRIQRQQVLLKSLRDRLQTPSVVPQLPKAVKLMLNYVDTNLSFEEILALVNFGMGLQKDDLKMVLLPGRFSGESEFGGISYWVMLPQERDRVLASHFDIEPDYELQARSLQGIRIAIQNATDEPQLARQVAGQLREAGFRNLFFSRYDPNRRLRETEIVVQSGNRDAAEAIQDTLGLGQLQSDSTGDLGSEITIRVGTDWLERLEAQNAQ
ncbi:MAG: LCP family protein [Spirulina sp. SIO3F2]|nr:LCP family protein [Spirulina sp. SIO3F2]